MAEEDYTQSEKFQRGLKKLKEISPQSGEGESNELLSFLDEIAPDVGRYAMEFVLGDILSRPGLDTKTREMLNIAVLTALSTEMELTMHINAALNCGVTRNEVLEIIIQQLVYIGFPKTISGLKVAKEVFDERDAKGMS